jgi:hypothetical protein
LLLAAGLPPAVLLAIFHAPMAEAIVHAFVLRRISGVVTRRRRPRLVAESEDHKCCSDSKYATIANYVAHKEEEHYCLPVFISYEYKISVYGGFGKLQMHRQQERSSPAFSAGNARSIPAQ